MIVSGLLLGAVGFGLLQLAYYAVRESWPLTYAALVDTYAITLPQRMWRVTLFRVVPTFVASSALIVTAWRLDATDWVAVSLAIGLHLILTNVRAILVTIFKADPSERVNYISYHLVAVIFVVGAAVLGAIISPYVSDFIPRPTELIQNLWFAGFVAVVGSVLVKASSRRVAGQLPYSAEYFIWRANRDVGVKVLDALFDAAIRHGADPFLLRAIMVAEVLQRPRWTRVLENFKGKFFPAGSYGVMQVASSRPISDLESIEAVAQEIAGTWGFSTRTYSSEDPPLLATDEAVLWTTAGKHNGDKPFIDSVTEIYGHLFYAVGEEWNSWAGTSAKIVEFRRYADRIAVRIVTNALNLELIASPSEQIVSSGVAESRWRALEMDLPPNTTTFKARVDGYEFEPVDLNVVATQAGSGLD